MPEDPQRTAAIRAGDRGVLEAVLRECIPRLLRAARAAGLSPEGAEDAVQSSLLVLVRRSAEYDGRARVCTWAHGILLRKIWEERRTARRDSDHDDIDDAVASRFDADGTWVRPPVGPVESLLRGELRRELAACLEGVPERQRVAFTLREIEDLDTAEICNILDVTANNLGVLLFRARNRLRECLETKGFQGSHDAALR